MKSVGDDSRPWVFLTGATGLLGSAVLHELLARSYRVLSIVRAKTPTEARGRLASALAVWGCVADTFLERGQLIAIRGDLRLTGLGLPGPVVDQLGGMVSSVVHAAGSTAFSPQADAGLVPTNVEGTRRAFDLAAALGCRDWHLFSTAYVCGRCARAEETLFDAPPPFRNTYEWTKWTAEHETRAAAVRHDACLTVYRPSVIVGHSVTGAVPRFSGIYTIFRAVALLARLAEHRADIDRRGIPLRIPAEAHARPNLVFADDVAREFCELLAQPVARGDVFHLTHPDPPTNREIQNALEAYYGVGGGRFVGAQGPPSVSQRSAYEDVFFDAIRDAAPYLVGSPRFSRTRTDQFVSRPPTRWDGERLRRLIHYAESSRWRKGHAGDTQSGASNTGYATYFQDFMPEAHRKFRLSRLPALNLDVRYVIGASGEGDWSCCYRDGRLIDVHRGNGAATDVTYRIAPAVFWRIVRGESSTAETFLSGEVQIEGNIEGALKFATVLQEFVHQFPYPRLREVRHEP
ncbi:MAG: SDR family oxidoreductase [Planctomycetes bacterium]|nr:SDR family oxidoreductase [Planctomycetota bacterium]